MRLLRSCLLLSAAGPAALCQDFNTQPSLHSRDAQAHYWPTQSEIYSTLLARDFTREPVRRARRLSKRHFRMVSQEPSPLDTSDTLLQIKHQVSEQRSRRFIEAGQQDSRKTSHIISARGSNSNHLDQSNISSTDNSSGGELVRRGSCFGTLRSRQGTRDPSLLDPAHIYAGMRVARTPAESYIAPSPFASFSVQHREMTPPKQITMTKSSTSSSGPSTSTRTPDSSLTSSPESGRSASSQKKKSFMSTSSGTPDLSPTHSGSSSTSPKSEGTSSGSLRPSSLQRASPLAELPELPNSSQVLGRIRALDLNDPVHKGPKSTPERKLATNSASLLPPRNRAAEIAAALGNKNMSEYNRRRTTLLTAPRRSRSNNLSSSPSQSEDPVLRRKSSPPPGITSEAPKAKELGPVNNLNKDPKMSALSPFPKNQLMVPQGRSQGSVIEEVPIIANEARRRSKQVKTAVLGPAPLPKSSSLPGPMASLPFGKPPLPTIPGRAKKVKQ